MTLRGDGTAECESCHLPMFPVSRTATTVTIECANRHSLARPLPEDRATRTLIDNWIAKRGAQLHQQHERWESEEQ